MVRLELPQATVSISGSSHFIMRMSLKRSGRTLPLVLWPICRSIHLIAQAPQLDIMGFGIAV